MLKELTKDLALTTGRIFAWEEHLNPTGSIKDTIVRYALKQALATQELTPGEPIVEASSGNTGCALAAEGKKLKHPVHIFVSSSVSEEKKDGIRQYDATLHVIPVEEGAQSEIKRAEAFAKENNYYFFNQFENP